jgi:sporulation protein YlmC with PRC-barrel domain
MRHILLSTTCAAALALSSAALAADKTTADGAGMRHAPSGNAAATTGSMTDIKADTLIGKSVTNYKDETVGDVESVILSPAGGIRAVVVSVGGFLGLGERLVALDWNDLEIGKNGDTVRVAATAEQLKAMPAYTYREDNRRGQAYQDERYREPARTAAGNGKRELKQAVAVDTLMDKRGNVKASELIGMTVVNATGETIGDIEEILISDSGKLDAVLGAGGFLGMGETRLLVAWNRLELHRVGDEVQVRTKLSSDELRTLPYTESK